MNKRNKCVQCCATIETEFVRINGKRRKVRGHNDCDSKWVVYALVCVECDLYYIGKTFTSFRTRWSNHKSKITRHIKEGIASLNGLTPNDGDLHLVKHFCLKHKDLSSLKWVVVDTIGKTTTDPDGNLLKWEHAYIEHFCTLWPKGLNSRE
jgi:hypothetical protein